MQLEQQTYRKEISKGMQGHPQLHCSLKNATAGHLFEYVHLTCVYVSICICLCVRSCRGLTRPGGFQHACFMCICCSSLLFFPPCRETSIHVLHTDRQTCRLRADFRLRRHALIGSDGCEPHVSAFLTSLPQFISPPTSVWALTVYGPHAISLL